MLKCKAILLLGDRQYGEAEPLFDELTKIEPENGDHWINLATCQKTQKQPVKH